MTKAEFGDWFAFKLEETEIVGKCIICKIETKKSIFATHIQHKKLRMGSCCGDDCYKQYKVKYGV